MMEAIYADDLARSRSDPSRAIAGRGSAMQTMNRDRNDIKCHFYGRVGHLKIKCLLRVKQQQKNDGQQPRQREEQQNHPRKQHQRNRGGERGPMWCSYHKTISHSDADCRAKRREQADGNAHITAPGPSRIKGNCSPHDLPEQDDQPERPYISFTATEVYPTAAIAAEQNHSEETWSSSSLSASRPWLFEERAKPAIFFGIQERSDFSYMNGETDSGGGSLYGMAPMEPEQAENEHKPHESGHVAILVDSGASGHYFGDTIIPDLNHRLQDYTSLRTPRAIPTARGAMLDATVESVLQGLITGDCGEQHLARIAILIVPGISRNFFSVKTAAREGIISIFNVNKLRLEAGKITVPLREKNDELYSFKLDLSADEYAGKELAMNAMAMLKCGIGGWVTLTSAAWSS